MYKVVLLRRLLKLAGLFTGQTDLIIFPSVPKIRGGNVKESSDSKTLHYFRAGRQTGGWRDILYLYKCMHSVLVLSPLKGKRKFLCELSLSSPSFLRSFPIPLKKPLKVPLEMNFLSGKCVQSESNAVTLGPSIFQAAVVCTLFFLLT